LDVTIRGKKFRRRVGSNNKRKFRRRVGSNNKREEVQEKSRI
jgi:hypothetical protein